MLGGRRVTRDKFHTEGSQILDDTVRELIVRQRGTRQMCSPALLYKVSLSLEAPNYCLCIQSNSAGFSLVNTGKRVHLKHARRHFEWNLVKDVHRRSVASRNWLKS